jgi:hemerythrin
MTYDDGSVKSATNQLYAEHRSIDALLRSLRRSEDRDELTELLDELHGQLQTHFEHEEHPGGLYERIGALSDFGEIEVRKLVDEHFRMLGSVRGMVTRLRHDDEPVAIFQAEIAKLISWIEDHEVSEHRLAELARDRS